MRSPKKSFFMKTVSWAAHEILFSSEMCLELSCSGGLFNILVLKALCMNECIRLMFNPLAELPKFWCKTSCANFVMNNRIKSIGLYLLISCTLYCVHFYWVYTTWNYCHQGQRWEKRVLKGWQQVAAEMEGSGQLVLLRLPTQPFCCGTANKGSLFQTPSSCRSLLELMINQVSTCTLKSSFLLGCLNWFSSTSGCQGEISVFPWR